MIRAAFGINSRFGGVVPRRPRCSRTATQPQMQGSNDTVPHCVTPEMLPGPAPDGLAYKHTCTYAIPGVASYVSWTPNVMGGTTWQASAVDPTKGYLYVCAIARSVRAWKSNPEAGGRPHAVGAFTAPSSGWSGSVAD